MSSDLSFRVASPVWLELPVLEFILTPGGTPTSRSQAASSRSLVCIVGTWRISTHSSDLRDWRTARSNDRLSRRPELAARVLGSLLGECRSQQPECWTCSPIVQGET